MTHQRSILIIGNPTSGRGRGRRMAEAVATQLRGRGSNVIIQFTETRGDGERLTALALRDAETRPACVVACGGDGTIQEVAQSLASESLPDGGAPVALALAPCGRCNDFARALGVKGDPRAIAETIDMGAIAAIDLGRVNGRYFCTVATAGIDAEVTDFVDRMRMPLSGTPAYVYGALRVLARFRPYHVRLTGHFGEVTEPIFIASTANTSSYGGAIPIAPEASPVDGALDICVIRYMSKFRALGMIPRVMLGRHRNHPDVRFMRVRGYTLDADEPMQIWADGEPIAKSPAVFEAASAAIRVCLPKSAPVVRLQ